LVAGCAPDRPAEGERCTRLQSLVDAAEPGATVRVPPCLYRETLAIARPVRLVGDGRAEVRGSDVWTAWQRRGAYWTHDGAPDLEGHGECRDRAALCRSSYQVFFDGRALRQAAGHPGSGEFSVEPGRIVVADDPTSTRMFTAPAGNRGEENRYWCGSGEKLFAWDGLDLDAAAFARTGGGAGSRALTDEAKAQLVGRLRLPTAQEPARATS
jgi:hypothetical protein